MIIDFVRLFFLFLMFAGYLVLTGFQFREVWKPKTWFSRERWYVLLIFAITSITLIPSIFYRIFLLNGFDIQELRNVTTITNTVNGLATMALIFAIYFKRYKE